MEKVFKNISYTDTKTISEGSPIGTLVGNLNASDQDSSDFTFSLVQGDGSNDLNNSYFYSFRDSTFSK